MFFFVCQSYCVCIFNLKIKIKKLEELNKLNKLEYGRFGCKKIINIKMCTFTVHYLSWLVAQCSIISAYGLNKNHLGCIQYASKRL